MCSKTIARNLHLNILRVIEFFIYGSLCASFGSGAMPKPTNNAGRCLKLKD